MFYGQLWTTLSQDLWALSFKILKYFELKILKFRILTRCTPQCLTLTDTRCVDPSYNYSPHSITARGNYRGNLGIHRLVT